MYVCGDRYVGSGRERERGWGGGAGGGDDECWWMDGCVLDGGRGLEGRETNDKGFDLC